MPPVIILDTEYITVEYLPDQKIIRQTVHKPIGDKLLKQALTAGSDALIKYGAQKWLSDDRKNGPVSREVVEWGLQGWAQRTIGAGWKYWADVVPETLAAAGTMLPVIDAFFQMGLQMMVFTDPEQAKQWLDSKES